MPEIHEISLMLGELKEGISGLHDDHAELKKALNRIVEIHDKRMTEVEDRVTSLDHRVTAEAATRKTIMKLLAIGGSALGLIVLFFSGTWDYWFPKTH